MSAETNLDTPPELPPRGDAVTWRALLVGAVMALLLGLWAGYTEMMIRGSPMANDFTAAAALYMLVLLLLGVHVPLRFFARRFAFTTAELATIYVLMLAAAAIPTRGFVEFLGPSLTSAPYYATSTNKWAELFVPYLDRLPWIVPQGSDVVRQYYEGLPAGASIPWGAWLRPALSWLAFCLAMCLSMICIVVILRRQWMENERLVYPMMQVPLDLLRKPAAGPGSSSYRNTLFWLGVALPFLLFSLRGLSNDAYFPDLFPKFDTFTRVRFLENTVVVEFRFSPITLGFMYFVRMDVLLGLWVSALAVLWLYGSMRFLGATPNVPKIGTWSYDTIRAFTGAGALLVFMAVVLYRARHHLWSVARSLWRNEEPEESKGEILSYRTAVAGLIASSAFMALWLVVTGLAWWQAVLFLGLMLLIFLALTRLVTETGLPVAMTPMCAGDFMMGLFGTHVFTTRNLVGLGLTYPYHSEMRTSIMALCANGLKLFHETVKRRRRLLLVGLLASVVLSYGGSTALMTYYPYTRGGANLDPFTFVTSARYSWRDAERRVKEPYGPLWKAYPWMVGGAAVMGALLAASHYIPNWPLHPIGIITSFHWAGGALFSSALFMWILKGLLLKYGGPWLFRRVRPVFVGMVVGEICCAGFWATLDVFVGARGNYVTGLL